MVEHGESEARGVGAWCMGDIVREGATKFQHMPTSTTVAIHPTGTVVSVVLVTSVMRSL